MKIIDVLVIAWIIPTLVVIGKYIAAGEYLFAGLLALLVLFNAALLIKRVSNY